MTQGRNAWGRVDGLTLIQPFPSSHSPLYSLLADYTNNEDEGDIPKSIRSAHHAEYRKPKSGRIQEKIHPSIFPTIDEPKASVQILDPFVGISVSFHITSESTITSEL